MTRVAVIGNAAGGKSTLCRQLSAARQLPYFPIDQMQWRPGWKAVSPAEFAVAHAAVLARPTWIIDGFGPWPDVENRLDEADTIIFVDLPLWLHCWWATKRQIASFFSGRPDGPEGCPMWRVTLPLYRMMWRVHRDVRPKLLSAIAKRQQGKCIFHLRSPRDMAEFCEEYCS